MSVEKFLKIGQQMSAKVPIRMVSASFFKKVWHMAWQQNGHTYLMSNLPYSFKISSFATCGISEAWHVTTRGNALHHLSLRTFHALKKLSSRRGVETRRLWSALINKIIVYTIYPNIERCIHTFPLCHVSRFSRGDWTSSGVGIPLLIAPLQFYSFTDNKFW